MFVGDIRHQLQMRLVQLLFMLLIGDLPRFSAIPKIVERHLHTQKLTQNHKQVGFSLVGIGNCQFILGAPWKFKHV